MGPPGAPDIGVLKGQVTVYDQYGDLYLGPLPTISLWAAGGYEATTDGRGRFQLDSVPTGNYALQLSGYNIAPTIVRDVHMIKDSSVVSLSVSQKPNFELMTINASAMAVQHENQVRITYAADARNRNALIFLNDAPLPDGEWYRSYKLAYTLPLPGGSTSRILRVPVDDLRKNGLFFGDIVYFAAAGYVINDASVYTSTSNGKNVYHAIGNIIADTSMVP